MLESKSITKTLINRKKEIKSPHMHFRLTKLITPSLTLLTPLIINFRQSSLDIEKQTCMV